MNSLRSFIAQVYGLLGIVGSMFAIDLTLTRSLIVQPLKNARLIVLMLIPLIVGLLDKSSSPNTAKNWAAILLPLILLTAALAVLAGLISIAYRCAPPS